MFNLVGILLQYIKTYVLSISIKSFGHYSITGLIFILAINSLYNNVITNDYLFSIERGSRASSFRLVKKIADYFGITIDSIF